MRRVHIFLLFVLILATAKKQNVLTTVDTTKLSSPEDVVGQILWNVQKRVIEVFTSIAAGRSLENPEEERQIRSFFYEECANSQKLNLAINQIETGQGRAYNKIIGAISRIEKEKIGVIGQMIDRGFVNFFPDLADVNSRYRRPQQGEYDANDDINDLWWGSYSLCSQGYELGRKFLEFIGPTNLPYWVEEPNGRRGSNTRYLLKFDNVIDEYVMLAAKAIFSALPRNRLQSFANAIREFHENDIRNYATEHWGEKKAVVVTPPPKPVVVVPSPEPVAETPSPKPVVESPSPEPVVEPPTPEPVVELPNPDPIPEVFVEMIDEIVEEVKEEKAEEDTKEKVAEVIENLINGESASSEEVELAEETGLTDLSKDELEEVIEKIEETIDDDDNDNDDDDDDDDDNVDEEAQCGKSTNEVESALTDSIVEEVKDKLDEAAEETIDDLVTGDKVLDDLEDDIADELELKDKTDEDLEDGRKEVENGEGDLSEKIIKIIDEVLPEELEEATKDEDEHNEGPIEELVENVIDDIPVEVIDIVEEVSDEELDDVIEEVADTLTEDLEDKHEEELEKEAEIETGEPNECSCDCDRE